MSESEKEGKNSGKSRKWIYYLIAGIIIIVIIILLLLRSCDCNGRGTESGSSETAAEEKGSGGSKSGEVIIPETPEEKDILIFTNGLEDVNVLEGTKQFNPDGFMMFDRSIIKGIVIDDTKVAYDKTGEYDINYTLVVDKEGYSKFQEAPKDHKPDFGTVDVMKEAGTDDLKVDVMRKVTVVTEKEAEKLAKKDIPVYTDDNKLVVESVAETIEQVTAESLNESTTEAIKELVKETEKTTASETTTKAPETSREAKESGTKASTPTQASETATAAPETTTAASETTKVPDATKAPDTTTAAPETTKAPEPTTKAHEHSWVPVTETVHHEAEYKTVHHDAEYTTSHHDAEYKEEQVWVVDQEAWDEYKTIARCSTCGKDITSMLRNGTDEQHMDVDGCDYDGYYMDQIQIHHDAEGHNETQKTLVKEAWDEKVVTKDAWDEQVKVKDAWDETVTTGYKCSGCGATK